MAVESPKVTTVAFIVRIWIEYRDKKEAEPFWRGVIEHVGTGERVYFEQIDQIASNLLRYIEAMGVKVDKPKS